MTHMHSHTAYLVHEENDIHDNKERHDRAEEFFLISNKLKIDLSTSTKRQE